MTRPTPLYVLILISMGSPIALNALLPALPTLADKLDLSTSVIQLSLSIYLAALAIGQLTIGGVINAIGLKKSLLVGMTSFTLGGILGLSQLGIEVMLCGRVLQGLGGAAMMSVARALLISNYGTQKASEKMGYIVMAIALSQAVAPLLGSLLLSYVGWHGIFLFSTLHGVVLWLLATKLVADVETNQKRQNFTSTLNLYRDLLANQAFRVYAISNTLLACAFYFFVSAAPYISTDFAGSEHEFGVWFMTISIAFMIGGYLSTFLNKTLPIHRTITIGNLLSIAGSAVMLLGLGLIESNFAWLFLPMCAVTLGRGIGQPSYQSAALGRVVAQSGMAAGLMGFLQLTCGSLVSQITPTLLEFGEIWIPTAIFACTLGAAWCFMRLSTTESHQQDA